MKKNCKIFCFGFGQVAKFFIKSLIENGLNFDLVTTNTTATQSTKFNGIKNNSYYFLDNRYDENLLNELNSSNKILVSISPQNRTDIVLKSFYKNFKKNKFDWVTYLSATSVYGDKKGKWVNENAKPEPTSQRGIERLVAEREWLSCYKDLNLPVQIFRLSGIYSPKNNIINRLKTGTLKIVEKKNHYFSRIHVEDIAEILRLSLDNFYPGQIFNISDDLPCSNEVIATYAAKLLKIDKPPKITMNEIENKMVKDFYKDSKKVSNKKMKSFFNYKLKYPTFKEGLSKINN